MLDEIEQVFNFESYRFEVIESDIKDETKHKVALYYISPFLTLYEVIGEYLLVGNANAETNPGEAAETYLIKIQSVVQITSYKELPVVNNILN